MQNMSKKLKGNLSKVLINIGGKTVNQCSIVGYFYEPKVSEKLLKEANK